MALSITTFSIIGLIVTLSINDTQHCKTKGYETLQLTLSIMTLSKMTLSIMSFSRMGFIVTLRINNTNNNSAQYNENLNGWHNVSQNYSHHFNRLHTMGLIN